MLDIVYCCNDKVFDGLYLSILSILRITSQNINFYVITGNLLEIKDTYLALSDFHKQLLEKLIKSFNNKNTLTVYDASAKYISSFGVTDIQRVTPYNMFKLFIPSFEYKGNKLLYLDVDTMANGDISLAFDINMDNAEICACHVLNIQIVFGNNSSYFNGGVFLINLQEVRKTNLFERALSYYLKYKPMTLEEAALNVNVKKLLFWPDEQRFNYQRKGIKDNTIIKHFVNPITSNGIVNIKPWDISGVKHWLKLDNWDEDYKIYLEQSKIWKKK